MDSSKIRILVVEDKPKVASFVKLGLEENGYSVKVAFDGAIGKRMFGTDTYDLVILDVNLPYKILRSMTADNYLVETTRRKDRLTVVPKRTKKITVTFKVPDNVVEDITFKILKPDGKVVEGKDKGIAYRVVNGDEGLVASTSGGVIQVTRKIEINYEPKEKQKPGLYRIEMYNAEKYLGTVNVKLR